MVGVHCVWLLSQLADTVGGYGHGQEGEHPSLVFCHRPFGIPTQSHPATHPEDGAAVVVVLQSQVVVVSPSGQSGGDAVRDLVQKVYVQSP